MTIRRALLSVSDKTNLVEFALQLNQLNIEIISTGGTAKLLLNHNIPVIEVADYTGFPEVMNGRFKTLHPKIHGGLLGRRGQDDAVMLENGIKTIDLVVVNLYPFAATIADPKVKLNDAIENIDIGGPAMIRAAAKNYSAVTVLVNVQDYQPTIDELQTQLTISAKTNFKLAIKAFNHTAKYDGMISNYLSSLDENQQPQKFPQTFNLQYQQQQTMRYGENPHQEAVFYSEKSDTKSVANAEQIQGKQLSYNNLADADAALECVKEFTEPACVIVKHANPCGVAVRDNILDAYQMAFKTDPTSAFGGIIAVNRQLDLTTCETIINQQFVEVIIAPTITDDAKNILTTKLNVRILITGQWQGLSAGLEFKKINGGLLVQDKDLGQITAAGLIVAGAIAPTQQQIQDLLFVWRVAKFVKSNAIVYGKDLMTLGIGAGQMSRIYSAKIAGIKAADGKLPILGSVMASDAFFPFRDGIDYAATVDVKAIIQPGGSMRDDEVIAAADEHKIAMVFTDIRHFRH